VIKPINWREKRLDQILEIVDKKGGKEKEPLKRAIHENKD